jgi:hypothetical protein
MDSNDSTTVRNALAQGDLSAVIDAIGDVDERADYAQVAVVTGEPDRTVTVARLGRAVILVQPFAGMDVRVFEDEDKARESYAETVAELGEVIVRQNDAARLIQSDQAAQQLLAMGAPPEMLTAAAMRFAQAQAQTALGVPVAGLDGPTVELPGFYL